MLDYWRDELFPALAALPFPVEIRFVGAPGAVLEERPEWPNLRLRFLGHLEQVAGEFARAAAFLSPMKHPTGIRTRVVTALSHGVPVIADPTTAPGLPELEDGRDVVYAARPEAVAAALRRVRDDPEWAETIGAAGRSTWERHFDPARNVPRLLEPLGLEL
jgi:glycosyltransferase involved in cell wall biosynthesis